MRVHKESLSAGSSGLGPQLTQNAAPRSRQEIPGLSNLEERVGEPFALTIILTEAKSQAIARVWRDLGYRANWTLSLSPNSGWATSGRCQEAQPPLIPRSLLAATPTPDSSLFSAAGVWVTADGV